MGLITQSRTVQTKQMDLSEFLLSKTSALRIWRTYASTSSSASVSRCNPFSRSHHLQRHNLRFQAVQHPAKSNLRMGLRYKNIAMKMGHILRLHAENFSCLSIDILRFVVGSLRNSRHGHGLIRLTNRFRRIRQLIHCLNWIPVQRKLQLPAVLPNAESSYISVIPCSLIKSLAAGVSIVSFDTWYAFSWLRNQWAPQRNIC